jgi:prepilin-type N-terminal cleavage/methylation domain-containing protein
MRRTIHPGSRGGFTLVELLVVVTIIAVLIALISSGVMAALSKGTEVSVRNEVTQLANGVQAFKAQFQVQYIPDRLVLPPVPDPSDDVSTQKWVADSQVFLKSVWPRLNPANMVKAQYWQAGKSRQILHGDQVLVWALGGWRDGQNVFGFNTDPTDPMKPYTPGQQRHGPFFEGFTTDRLKLFTSQTGPEIKTLPKRASNFPSFVDYYGKVPYLYFSSGKAGNDYGSDATRGAIAAPQDDPNTPWAPVLPYKISTNKFANASGFQIVSAGKDGLFGIGDQNWSGGGGQLSPFGRDDISNFSATKLGD